MPDRDRDALGRPRNARPRDETGRPLPRTGATSAPPEEQPALGGPETLTAAQRLLDEGRPFAAHEVLEAAWKSAPAGQRGLWRALAQLAVGLTHAQRGNMRGAVALLERGRDGLAPYVHDAPDDVDVPALLQTVGVALDAVRTGAVPPPVRLRRARPH